MPKRSFTRRRISDEGALRQSTTTRGCKGGVIASSRELVKIAIDGIDSVRSLPTRVRSRESISSGDRCQVAWRLRAGEINALAAKVCGAFHSAVLWLAPMERPATIRRMVCWITGVGTRVPRSITSRPQAGPEAGARAPRRSAPPARFAAGRGWAPPGRAGPREAERSQ